MQRTSLVAITVVLISLSINLRSDVFAETSVATEVQQLRDQPNLSRGGSFESQGLGDFNTQVQSGKAEVTVTTARAHSGKQSLQIKGEKASVDVSQTISVEPDTIYEISFWVYTEDLVGRGVTGLLVNSDQFGLLPYVSPSQRPNDGKWHEFKVFTHSGPATKLKISLTFGLWEDKASGTVCYDDLSIRAIARSKAAYPLAADRPLPPGVTMRREAQPPYEEPFDTTSGYPVDRFQPTLESLHQYQCPEWFRDAKFGIYLHWGPYSVAERECWFPRLMYVDGYEEHEWFRKKFGDVGKFGYKDLIPLWKGENFDPDRLVRLFKRAGARYVTPVAVHHDNFDLWDSQYHRWNSVEMGPKKDITGMWREAVLRHGLRFGVTTHLAWSYSWWGVNKGADHQGPQAGVPYDGNDPKYADLYHLPNGERGYYPINPTARWRFEWALRTMDLIDKYHPDLLYFDGAIPFNGVDKARTGMEVIAYYYNRSIQWHDGKLEGVMTIKQGSDGLYDEHVATLDLERTTSSEIRKAPWQTDDSIGPWAYKQGAKYKSVDEIVDQLVDIVSKNGNLLLNVPPRADGTLDQETEAILNGIGEWMDVNGEAIYSTRPWRIAEEGALRFTKKGHTLYAIALEKPSDTLVIRALGKVSQKQAIRSISLLGSEETIRWKQSPDHLEISVPAKLASSYAWAFKIELDEATD
jgi:alpha-L-fucosidase